MGVKYFGQFLLERGAVSAADLEKAIALQQSRNFDLGKVCTTLGFLSQEAADGLNERQRFVDRKWGELAVEERLITESQLAQALKVQKQARVPLGGALVEIGALDDGRLAEWLAAFDQDQAPYRVESVSLPSDVPDPEVAQAIVDLGRKLLVRVARVPTKLSPPVLAVRDDVAGEAIASQSIDGQRRYGRSISAPRPRSPASSAKLSWGFSRTTPRAKTISKACVSC